MTLDSIVFGTKFLYRMPKWPIFGVKIDIEMKNKRNVGKAVVMGATSGIGLEVVRELCRRGWQVGIAARREEVLKQIQVETPGVVAWSCIDITRDDAPARLTQFIDEMGGIDLYFHSSGIGYQNPQLDTDKELRTVETNALGFTRMVDATFAYFAQREQPGHIAVISSIARTKGLGAAPAYSATKRYVSHYMESLEQLRTIRHLRHVHLHDIRPGFVRTPLIADGNRYPMQLDASRVSRSIVCGIERNRKIITIDWRYRLLVAGWRLIPRWLWVRLPISTAQ